MIKYSFEEFSRTTSYFCVTAQYDKSVLLRGNLYFIGIFCIIVHKGTLTTCCLNTDEYSCRCVADPHVIRGVTQHLRALIEKLIKTNGLPRCDHTTSKLTSLCYCYSVSCLAQFSQIKRCFTGAAGVGVRHISNTI